MILKQDKYQRMVRNKLCYSNIPTYVFVNASKTQHKPKNRQYIE